MEEWKEYRLGEILNFRRGHDLPKSKMQDGDVPVAGSNGIIGYHNEYTPISPCITIGRSGNVGTPYIYDKCWAHNTVLYIDDYKGNEPKFLYYFLKTLPLSSFGGGSAVPTLNRNHIHPMIVKFCKDIKTQQKIASILSSLDDKIEVNRRINEQLEELAQALFKSWFVDFEPFKDGEFVESELGMIPKGWKVGKYTDMVDIRGGTPKTDISEYWNGEIPFFTPKDVNNNVYCIETEKNITELGLSKCSSRLYSKNTVFITARGTVGKICMAGRDMAMNQTCYALLGKENYGQHFIYMQTINIVERMKKKANGAVFSAITTRDFDSEKIVIPSVEIVSDFLPKIKSIYESILRNQQEILHLTTLRDTLLPS